ncbi:MAG: outer membrane protein transport protein [Sulfurimonas sp.]|uniref:OmpP1/FadL family transporter n=1 Tax=Sulfurimonas sp. TaxID=2022749 RepID=UPI002639607E|nr:outer membrane protein transport protein [Sulfurimonas sp.]MDD2653052.1 outer membrane protein transport protein [Sulfurimonas sp.]MDD3452255.1 outer membrane protein transport protein [Sulfurimonas sp.]
MKRTIKLAVVAALALGATSAFATNGSAMIGMGAKTRGMGGAGIGVGHGAESALSNPALITTIKSDHEISFGGTLFMPNVETTNGMNMGPGGDFSTSMESDADFFVIPSVSVANKVSDNFYWGVGMWGTGGLGVDYRDDSVGGMMGMVTSLQNMQFGIPLVYTANKFSVGITPIVQYTALDINYKNPMDSFNNVGAGVADDVSVGYNLGLAYETQGITLGAVYKSEVESNIKDVLSNAINPMIGGSGYDNNKISTPAEMGVGISYKMKEHTIALDYKMILWEDAETYKDFGWEDQNVIAVGYEYATDKWAVRAGYQYAKSAVQDNTGKNLALDAILPNLTNTFNMLGFPGTQESHITLGGTYVFNETLSLDLAAVFGLENKETMTNFLSQNIETKHSEQSYSVQLNYAF